MQLHQHHSLLQNLSTLEKNEQNKNQLHLKKLKDICEYNNTQRCPSKRVGAFTNGIWESKSTDKREIELDIKDYHSNQLMLTNRQGIQQTSSQAPENNADEQSQHSPDFSEEEAICPAKGPQ